MSERDLGYAVLDLSRADRTGLPEVVFGATKTVDQLVGTLGALADAGQPALATRVGPAEAAAVLARDARASYDSVGRLLQVGPPHQARSGRVAVIAAGTSDLPVTEEAAGTLTWAGVTVDRITDVGVAGLHRLLSRLSRLAEADVLIVAAGMEGALPSVIGGLTDRPIIAVPTSVGLGAHEGGRVPLMAMLNSCAPGLVVVNVDNGFGAAAAALRMLGPRR